MRYWTSWTQESEDYRSINFPPNESILGWWVTGYAGDGVTICALVEAESRELAEKSILEEWPEALDSGDWRLFEDRENDYVPGDRFPLSDWMKGRI